MDKTKQQEHGAKRKEELSKFKKVQRDAYKAISEANKTDPGFPALRATKLREVREAANLQRNTMREFIKANKSKK